MLGIWNFSDLVLGICLNAYALNITKVKTYFLSGDYKAAIIEGEKTIAGAKQDTTNLDELYYILGVSYLKDNNLLRASDIFEIILSELGKSDYKERAKIGLADVDYLRGNYEAAVASYKDILNQNPKSDFKSILLYKISQCDLQKGNTAEAKEYLSKLKEEFPLSFESMLEDQQVTGDLFYTVQVGAFSSKQNAQNLTQLLKEKGFDAYVEKTDQHEKVNYRVRVGKFPQRSLAVDVEKKLSSEGYPTKIFP